MEKLIHKIGTAISFSENSEYLLSESLRYKNIFASELILIHAGEKNKTNENKFQSLLEKLSIDPNSVKIELEDSEPFEVIKKKCLENNVDLLVCGALEKESLIKYYTGSVARNIMRELDISIFVCKNVPHTKNVINKISVLVDFSESGKKALKLACQIAHSEKLSELTLIREMLVPGLSLSTTDTGTISDAEESRLRWCSEEKEKINLFLLKELNLAQMKFNIQILYGKEGFKTREFVSEEGFDLLIVAAPSKKYKLIDRIIKHDLEYIFEDLPSNILIVKA